MVNTVVIQTPETTGDAPEDHNQKMIDKADGVVTEDTGGSDDLSGNRPAWLPEKFKSAEDMAKAYSELEGKLGSQSGDTPVVPAADAVPPSEEVEAALANGGLSLTEFSTEYDTTGSLSTESYAKLAAAGFDKALVDSYVAGQEAKASLHTADLKSTAGGAEAYDKMVNWAKASMTTAEVNAYNLSVSSNNVDAAKLAISGLKSRYEAANGREPKLHMGSNTASDSNVFESRTEITTAMKDPRYAKDPAYRQKVIDKVHRSKF